MKSHSQDSPVYSVLHALYIMAQQLCQGYSMSMISSSKAIAYKNYNQGFLDIKTPNPVLVPVYPRTQDTVPSAVGFVLKKRLMERNKKRRGIMQGRTVSKADFRWKIKELLSIPQSDLL